MTRPPRDLATSDCEHCRDGFITQPVNTASSLAYVASGAALLRGVRSLPAARRPAARALGWSVVAAGIGSVAYHGPGGRFAHWTHDASVIAMLGFSAVATAADRADREAPPMAALVAVPLLAGLAAHPRTSGPAQAVAGVVVAAGEIDRVARSGRAGPEAAAWLAAMVAYGLGRSDAPTCRPDSLVQPHAAWHALSALALWLRARSTAVG